MLTVLINRKQKSIINCYLNFILEANFTLSRNYVSGTGKSGEFTLLLFIWDQINLDNII